METAGWYLSLVKPDWAPPAWLFGPVWSVLYVLIFISFSMVIHKAWKGELSRAIALPFILNIVFNFIFSPIQFTLQNNILAAIDILLILGTLAWAMVAIYPCIKWIAFINIPYLLWVTFATVLQISITILNW